MPVNNAAERALRGVAVSRKAWLFCGSDRVGERAAAIYTLIGTAKLNAVDPQAWLAGVLEPIAQDPIRRLTHLPRSIPKVAILAGWVRMIRLRGDCN